MNAVYTWGRISRSLPDVHPAHWLLRGVLAAVIANQGVIKFPLTAADAESFGVPFVLWAMAAFGEIAAGTALIVGGFLRNGIGDVITRIGGLFLAAIVGGVLVVVYWAPPLDLFLANQFHLVLLAGGLYFLFRGNSV